MKPKPSLFARLLTISGLELPFSYFVTLILDPILTPIVDALSEWVDPANCQPGRAAFVRTVAQKHSLNACPIVLNERERCTGPCGNYKLLFVEPDSLCWDCWREKIRKEHGLCITIIRRPK